MRRESVMRNNSSIGGSSSSHYYPRNLNSLGHGICVHQENISVAEGLEPGTPTPRLWVNHATNELSWHIYIPLSGPLRGPAGPLPMPWRYPPDIPYTLQSPVGSHYRDTYGHRPYPGNVFRKWGQVSSDSRAGTRRDPPGLRQGICKTRFDHDHSAQGPPGTKITAVLTARTGPGLIVT